MKKVGVIVCLLMSIIVLSQVDASVDRRKGRWAFGGGLGLGFSNGFFIQANPDIGYRMKNFEFGASVGINYENYKGDNYYVPYKSTLWNVGPYILYMPVQSFYITSKYQYYDGKQKVPGYQDYHVSENALWIGGGFQQKLAQHTYMRFGLLYNVLYDSEDSIFSSGLYPSIGISAGL